MTSIQFHLKPRPVSLMHGHSNYLSFKWPFDFEYGPFFLDYGPIPSDASELYIVQSSALATSLSMLYDDLMPRLDVEVPSPNRLPRSTWRGLLQPAMNKVDASFRSRMECEDHIVQLIKGDRAPTPPPPSKRTQSFSPEWYDVLYPTLFRGDIELRDEPESRDAELELYIWTYMYHLADERTSEIPGLFNLVGSAAASIIALAFATETSIDENEPPRLSSSSRSGSSATDSTTSSHAGDLDDGDNDANLSALHHLSRRRNYTSDTINL